MYRVFAIVAGGLMLAACASGSSTSWLDSLKPAPPMDSLRLESEPAGAEARVPSGQSCRTPCALDVPAGQATSVTFTLAGYKPETVPVEAVQGGGYPQLSPNPVTAELEAAPPPPRKPAVAKKKVAKKKPAPKTSAAPPPAPQQAAPPPPAAQSPWPSPTPAPQR
ncbi:MAG TPA: hypothetical protein VFB45_02220 [Pseudolabrys sp.]|nr:hypothetical protein [Pseudolabrys sp.]